MELPPLTQCSHFVLVARPDVNASEHSRRPRPQPCLKRRSTRGFARYADREHVSGGRNRTIDRSKINGLRAGADAQGTSAGEEDLEVDVAVVVRSGRLELTITIDQFPNFAGGRSGWTQGPRSCMRISMHSMH